MLSISFVRSLNPLDHTRGLEGFIGLGCLDYVNSPLYGFSMLSRRIFYFAVVSHVDLRIDVLKRFELYIDPKKIIEHLINQCRKILQLVEFWNLRQYMVHIVQ